jgi:hypothetical protein
MLYGGYYDEPKLFNTVEDYNVSFLYILSISYGILKIYYSFSLFLNYYRIILMMMGIMLFLEEHLTITKNELMKIIIVITSFIVINDIFPTETVS